jgi:hypothetical protein
VKAASAADLVRDRLGEVIFQRVAGPQGVERRRLVNAPGERWFAEDRPVRRVHGDSSMFIGGITALLLQSLHPLAMAAVAGHSGYRGDPWGRLQRTSYFLAVTTFGRASDARSDSPAMPPWMSRRHQLSRLGVRASATTTGARKQAA